MSCVAPTQTDIPPHLVLDLNTKQLKILKLNFRLYFYLTIEHFKKNIKSTYLFFLEGPLLGRGSRVKRIRSANKRAASAMYSFSDRQRLFAWSNGESSSNTSSLDNGMSTPTSMFVKPRTAPPSASVPSSNVKEDVKPKSRPRPKTARANR